LYFIENAHFEPSIYSFAAEYKEVLSPACYFSYIDLDATPLSKSALVEPDLFLFEETAR
jgi:hypothetical protein